ncbi:hypothetical protein EJ06DRAFT_42493 [Trichodelitschia bisporula]|uniref:BTB domain-containing protein n=1 Tax=Trichodelitschia bisporula TaxID=703511 RepID=A0A6G1HVB5_9PEZI|nr:hypothetical protein EJ06DRAFT_42493 [Trichodelitschia bisporula]
MLDAGNLTRTASGRKARPKTLCLRYEGLPRYHSSANPRSTAFKTFDRSAAIIVGSQGARFLVHKELFARQSPFFAAALNGAFAEGVSQAVHLPDVEAKTFEHVVLWMYTGRLERDPFFYKDGKPTYFTLLDIYALADQLCVEGLRNAVVDKIAALAETTNSVPTPTDTFILYEAMRHNAPVRRLILDVFAFKKTDNIVATHPDDWHPTFLRDLVCKLKRPGWAALRRHELRAWRPLSWQGTKACEICKAVLKPGASGSQCAGCNRAFCAGCVGKGMGSCSLDWAVAERECKPWLRGMCEYHEHEETEKCPPEAE